MTAVLFRLWIYEYLAQLFDGTLEQQPGPPDAVGSPPCVPAAVEALRTAVTHSSLDEVLADQARLFVSARHGVAAPPYASWYLDGELCGPSSRWVEEAYAAQGLERAPDAGEPPDYIGAELEFLHFLARHELAARSTGDDASLRLVLGAERNFVLNHVARWLPAFIERIRSAEPTLVFAAATELLRVVIEEEVRRLSMAPQFLSQVGKRMKQAVSEAARRGGRFETDCCRDSGNR